MISTEIPQRRRAFTMSSWLLSTFAARLKPVDLDLSAELGLDRPAVLATKVAHALRERVDPVLIERPCNCQASALLQRHQQLVALGAAIRQAHWLQQVELLA